jgi:hypothetical protein
MPEQINLQEAEKKTLRLALFQDGVWDILLGCLLVLLSVYPILRRELGPALNALLVLAIMFVLAAAAYVARRHVTTPRIGQVRLGVAQRAKIKRLQIVVLALVLVTFVLWILVLVHATGGPLWAGAPGWLKEFGGDILFAAIIVGLFSLMASLLGIRRLYLYGWLFGLGNLASTILAVERSLAFLFPLAISGGIIVLVGRVTLARFLHNYPIETIGE